MTLWGGRFSTKLDEQAWNLNTSLPFDQRLALQDVRGSIAWAGALQKANVLSSDENAAIISGLNTIATEFSSGAFLFAQSDEDIHTAVERRLGELAGSVAGKLHTGRSRNDQVATDLRLWMLETFPFLNQAIMRLQQALVTVAERNQNVLMPGYTHLQRAQPITLAHCLWVTFGRCSATGSLGRLREPGGRLALGCGALAGQLMN